MNSLLRVYYCWRCYSSSSLVRYIALGAVSAILCQPEISKSYFRKAIIEVRQIARNNHSFAETVRRHLSEPSNLALEYIKVLDSYASIGFKVVPDNSEELFREPNLNGAWSSHKAPWS